MKNTDWIQTYTGKAYDLLNPSVDSIDLRDIAHALSMQCRFNGNCVEFYSVAQHSVLVMKYCGERTADRDVLRAALMHDAQEAYLGDLVRPIKVRDSVYRGLESISERAIADRFSLLRPLPALVKEADNALLLTEQGQLMAAPPKPWAVPGTAWDVTIFTDDPPMAEEMFLHYAELLGIS